MAVATYPVRVEAHLDPHLNRWMWLVKWVLVIPHYIVLAFLWMAFAVLSVVAFFAILFTGRYPRAVFDFNVGVLRWTWRVAYYAYGALGTDRYPPFTLDEVPDYPAHLEVTYPDHLSRGLVLVKWWLLAIPHYVVVAFLAGTGLAWAFDSGEEVRGDLVWGGGLIGLLVLVAAVVLLFTGRYPQGIFDLVLGLNRWVIRVAGYAGLMTDAYPPFRLDMGGDDPGTVLHVGEPPGAAGPQPPPAGTAPRPQGGRPWGTGRILVVVIGSVVSLVSLGLLAGGATVGVAGAVLRDDDGFLMSDEVALATDTHALASATLQVRAGGVADTLPRSVLGDAKVEVTGPAGEPLFVGVGRSDDVAGYLADVGYATVEDLTGWGPDRDPQYGVHPGGAPGTEPDAADFWVARSSGTGTQQVVWPVEEGDWTIVVMNTDGSTDVEADVAAGATVPGLGWVVAGLLVAGLVGLLVGAVVLFAGLRTGAAAGSGG